MKLAKKILKWIFYFLLIPISYVLISLLLSAITISRQTTDEELDKTIFLSTNGIHLDIIVPIEDIEDYLLSGLKRKPNENYLAFGWGDEDFYINTPNWGDLTFGTAFNAMFLKSSTLMHVTRYQQQRKDWIEIPVSKVELQKLTDYISGSFRRDTNGKKIMLPNKGYTSIDDFYRANGNYSCFKTCNSWANTGFKESGLKSSLWTPFDFGLMNKYK